jgi:hypothetical protein
MVREKRVALVFTTTTIINTRKGYTMMITGTHWWLSSPCSFANAEQEAPLMLR